MLQVELQKSVADQEQLIRLFMEETSGQHGASAWLMNLTM